MEISLPQLEVLSKAILHFGEARQTDKVIEECSELILAIQKHKYNPTDQTLANIIDEAADVLIMVHQIGLMTDFEEVNQRISYKIGRLESILNNI